MNTTFSFLKKKQFLFGVDIGATGIKVVELDMASGTPRLAHRLYGNLSGEVFSGSSITHGQKVADKLSEITAEMNIGEKKAVVGLPAQGVFTKRIKVPKLSSDELRDHVNLEAANVIPHNINALKLDYHVIGEGGKGQFDILVVAAKNESVDSFVDTLGIAGMVVGIADVDYFAVQNVFEVNYPEYVNQNVALVHIGCRYSSVNICNGGETLFTGDIAIGGRSITESVSEQLGVSSEEAERMKISGADGAKEAISLAVELAAGELNRQLSFFWNATGSEEGIDLVVLSGGGALTVGLKEAVAARTGIETVLMDPFRMISAEGATIPQGKDLPPAQYACAVGLALRTFGDRTDLEKLR